jgi:anti-sigma factor (TIGR02949 family)
MSHECEEALANLYLYLDAEMDQMSAAKLKSHLEVCQGCDAPFDFERRLREVVRTRLNEQVPEEFIARLHVVLSHEISGL